MPLDCRLPRPTSQYRRDHRLTTQAHVQCGVRAILGHTPGVSPESDLIAGYGRGP